jgi:hypothetical protein
VRDEVASRLALDPGVLCSREKLETIARRMPTTIEELYETPDLRRWQADLLADGILRALATNGSAAAAKVVSAAVAAAAPAAASDSPYRD